MSRTPSPTAREIFCLGGALLRAIDGVDDETAIAETNTLVPIETSSNDMEPGIPILETNTLVPIETLNNDIEPGTSNNDLEPGTPDLTALFIQAQAAENKRLSLALADHRAENKRLVSSLADHRAKSQYFEDETATLQRDVGIMILHVRDFQETVSGLRSENAGLKDARAAEVAELQAALECEKELHRMLYADEVSLKAELEAVNVEHAILKETYAGLRGRMSKRLAELRAEKAELVSDCADVEAENGIRRDAYDTLERVHVQQKREVQRLALQVRVDEDAIFTLREEVAGLRDSIERMSLREEPEERSRWQEQWAQATAVAETQVQEDIPHLTARNLHLEKVVSFHCQEIEHLKTVVSAHVENIANLMAEKTALLNDPCRWARRDEIYEALRLENSVQVERFMGKQAELDSLEGFVDGAVALEARNDRLEALNRSQHDQIQRLEMELAQWQESYGYESGS